jgi:pyruvyltransferase
VSVVAALTGSRHDLRVDVGGVDVVRWNPRVAGTLGLRGAVSRRRRDNFGDLLGPLIVNRIATMAPAASRRSAPRAHGRARLVAVGSIVHLAEDGDVVWGAGVNGKIEAGRYRWTRLDVRAVRGPLTERFLARAGQDVPAVHGDPAQLLPQLFPLLGRWAGRRTRHVTVMPNLNERDRYRSHRAFLDPTSALVDCLRTLVQSDLVVGSSLHAIIVAEAFGVPARFLSPVAEHDFKYRDYLAATGRADAPLCPSLDEALRLGGYEPPVWDPRQLLDAFPHDLWDLAYSEGRR